MKKTIKLLDLDCGHCAAKIETAVKKIDGVTNVSVNFMNQKMILEAPDDKFDAILTEAKALIKKIEPDVTVTANMPDVLSLRMKSKQMLQRQSRI